MCNWLRERERKRRSLASGVLSDFLKDHVAEQPVIDEASHSLGEKA